MKTHARMASPTRANGMPTKMARCTAMITQKPIHMGTDILTIMGTHTATVTVTLMAMIMIMIMTTDTAIPMTHSTP
jgi:hypothetical protein